MEYRHELLKTLAESVIVRYTMHYQLLKTITFLDSANAVLDEETCNYADYLSRLPIDKLGKDFKLKCSFTKQISNEW